MDHIEAAKAGPARPAADRARTPAAWPNSRARGRAVADLLLATDEVRRAATVAAYVSVGREPGTGILLDALRRRRQAGDPAAAAARQRPRLGDLRRPRILGHRPARPARADDAALGPEAIADGRRRDRAGPGRRRRRAAAGARRRFLRPGAGPGAGRDVHLRRAQRRRGARRGPRCRPRPPGERRGHRAPPDPLPDAETS